VNSFGYGGTNAHVIIDDPDSYLRAQKPHAQLLNKHFSGSQGEFATNGHLIVFTARDEAALARLRQSYKAYVAEVAGGPGTAQSFDETAFLERLSYTLGCRRSVFSARSAIVTPSLSHLAQELRTLKPSFQKAALAPRVGFVFTGQGAQWAKMGWDLMRYPVFASSIHEADEHLTKCLHSSWSVVQELENEVGNSRLELAEFSQPLSTILQVALVDLLRSWQISPAAVVGHSSGEIAAAYAIGAISKIDAWKISYLRGQLCAALPTKAPNIRGSMMAVGLGPDAAQEHIDRVTGGKVVIACVNSPSSVTISGDETGIDELLAVLKLNNIFARKLRVQNAYHSHHMKLLADEYSAALKDGMNKREPRNGTLPIMASSVTGRLITPTELVPDYWVQNLVSPVLFSQAVEILLKQPRKGRRQTRATEAAFDVLLEIGPHAALKGPLRQILQAHHASHVPYISVLQRGENGSMTALAAAGTLFCHGVAVDIQAANHFRDRPSLLTDLPSYPWNHSLRYWADSRISRARQGRRSGRHDLIGARTQDSDDLEPRWRHFLRVSDNPWIKDHVVQNSILYPGSGILGMPIHALQELADPSREIDRIELRDVHISKALVVPDDQFGLEVFLRLRRRRQRESSEAPGLWEFSVCSNQENDQVEEHGHGYGIIHYRAIKNISAASKATLVTAKFRKEYEEAQTGSTTQISPEAFYAAATSVGLTYGPSFQGLAQIKASRGICAWEIHVPDTQKIMPAQAESPHIIHPTTLDIVFHSLFAASGNEAFGLKDAAIPIGLESLSISANLPTGCNARLYGFSKVTKGTERNIMADIYAAGDQSDVPGIIVQGLRCRELPRGQESLESLSAMKAPVGHVVQKIDISLLETSELAKHILKTASFEASSQVDCESTIPMVCSWSSRPLFSLITTQIFDLIAHKNSFASLLQVGSVSRSLTERILSVLDAGSGAMRRFRKIQFIDSDSALINELASTYENLNSYVQFVQLGPDAPLPVDTDSMDLVLLSDYQLSGVQWSERQASGIRVVKPGGKVLALTAVQRACDA
jgi:zearalenone synthase (highly reducing iterative type I polyketide synthase)